MAKKVAKQHTSPCAQCPFRRTAPKGYLGGEHPDTFKWIADADVKMACHTVAQAKADKKGESFTGISYPETDQSLPQCAGRAIYWANQCKRPRDPKAGLLVLPSDTETVFQWPFEFVAHHKGRAGDAN